MLFLKEAQQLVLDRVTPLPPEEVGLAAAWGRVLAEDICADRNIPPQDNSAMDGYAVRAEELAGASASYPVALRLIGESTAGAEGSLTIAPGETVAVMTGAALPQGADAIVPQEFTKLRGAEVEFYLSPKLGEHIRRIGEDISKGSIALQQGSLLSPPAVGMLAGLGRASVLVTRQPKVAILATGNELVEVGQPAPPSKIYNSNSYMLAAQVREAGGVPQLLGIAPDDKQALAELIQRGMKAQVLIISGGVSVGKYDLVKPVLEELGMRRIFWRVAIKPGLPTLFGQFGSTLESATLESATLESATLESATLESATLVFGLPGNPASAAVTFELFVRPALDLFLDRRYHRQPFLARMAHPIQKKKGRRNFLRVNLKQKEETLLIRQQYSQGAGMLSSLQGSDGLGMIPEECELVEAGELIEFWPWPWWER